MTRDGVGTGADVLPDDRQWAALTASDEKRRAFQDDTYFREAWGDGVVSLGERLEELLPALALFSFKPDAIPSGRMGRALELLQEYGFVPIVCVPLRHNRHSMRELWRYNWHVYPVDRLAMCTLLHTAAPTLLLLLRDRRYDGVVPGAVRLSALKGSAEPSRRRPGQLRTVLEPPNAVINFVHVADEPADVVRELGVFADRPQRRALLTAAVQGWDGDAAPEARARIQALEAEHRPRELTIPAALDRLRRSAGLADEVVDRLARAADEGPRWGWEELVAVVDPARPDVDVWDFLLLASTVLPTDRPGDLPTELLPAPGPDRWRSRAGENR